MIEQRIAELETATSSIISNEEAAAVIQAFLHGEGKE